MPNRQSQINFDLQVAKGLIPGHSAVNKYGRAADGIQLTLTDIWDRADAAATQQIWLAPTAARIHALVSSSLNDSDTGGVNPQSTGARTIEVTGLKTWATAETSETVIMDGTTAVNTSESYVIIHRMKVLTHGTGGPNVGVIIATAATDGTVTAEINAGNGQTEMSMYGIPSTQVGYMTSFDVNAHNTGNPSTVVETDFDLLINEHPDVDPTSAAFIIKANIGLIASGSTVFTKAYDPPFRIDGPAIIKFQSVETTADNKTVSAYD